MLRCVLQSEDPQVMLGQTYDLAGPEEYTVREVLEYVFETMRAIEPSVVNLSPRAAGLLGDVMALMPYPPFTRDLMVRMTEDNVLDTSAPTKRFADLGLEVASMEAPEYSFLHKYRTGRCAVRGMDHFMMNDKCTHLFSTVQPLPRLNA